MTMILILAALAGGAAEAAADQCRRVHHTADGRTVETMVALDGDGVSASSSSRASGSGSSRSSVSASSSSSSSGSESTATSVSVVDGVRRSTTIRRDRNGCVITVDDRPPKE